jgi:hypothetical protein
MHLNNTGNSNVIHFFGFNYVGWSFLEIERRHCVYGFRFNLDGDISSSSIRNGNAFGRDSLNIGSNTTFDTFYEHLFDNPVHSFGCLSELSSSFDFLSLLYVGRRIFRFYSANRFIPSFTLPMHYEQLISVNNMFSGEIIGNVIDLCPVGALTSKQYAFTGRPWEMVSTESLDILDSLCSNIRIDSRGSEVMRVLPRLNYLINNE